jgi:uncharacterized membrane protein
MLKKLLRLIFNYFIKGAIVLVPLVGAIALLFWAISGIDSALNLSGQLWTDQKGRPVYIPGLGILSVLVILVFAGFLVTNFVTEPIKNWFGKIVNRIPLFKTLYSSIKDFTEAFVGDDKKFNEPVIVKVNDSGLKKIGFLTQRDLSSLGLEGEVMVYFPYAYSFAGQVSIAKVENVKPLNMSATDAMKLAVSGGVSGLG